MAMDGRHEGVECSISCSRNFIDAIERQSVGISDHKAKKFFSLRGKTAKSGQCGQKINSQTYSDLVYETLHRPQRDIDYQNSHGCDDGRDVDWKKTPGS